MNNMKDKLGISENKSINEYFDPDESVLLSTLIVKVNQSNKKQQRIFVITNKAIYNILPKSDNMFKKMFGKIIHPSIVKRKIRLGSIYSISISTIGAEFVIHVPNEYDYRFLTSDFRLQIFQVLIQAYTNLCNRKLAFYFKEEFTLVQVCTTEKDKKKGVNRLPSEKPLYLDESEFNERYNLKGQSELIFQHEKKQHLKEGISIDDFDLIKVLGRGAFGKVMMCEKKDTKELYAIKSLRKEHLIDKKQIEHTRAERKLLEEIDNPFLIQLEYAFQTREKIFFVMRFMRGGELFKHLRDKQRFSESTARFYAAQIILAIEYLHKKDYVYRDLKPENILMDEQGYLKLTDYGLAKQLAPGTLTHSFVGTPEYLAPEIITQKGHNQMVDLWSFGILIYEMLVGRPPFYSKNQLQLFKQIVEQELVLPPSLSPEVKDLIKQLLNKNQNLRIGINEIKNHKWFNNFPFDQLEQKKLKAPIIPKLRNKTDVQNFDTEFTQEEAENTYVYLDAFKEKQFQEDFGPLTYIPQLVNE